MDDINVYDIETFKENDKVIPYCICYILNGVKHELYWSNDKDIILQSIEDICLLSSSKFIEIFVHNLNFDGMLIIEHTSKSKININFKARKTNLYYLELYFLNKIIRFRCSYKLIPMSLKKLGVIEKWPKMLFPHAFITREKLFYIGELPDKIFWQLDSDEEKYWSEIVQEKKIFNVKNEIISYCMNDVVLTQKVLINVVKIISSENKKLIKSCFSAASLSFNIFRLKYNTSNINLSLQRKDAEYVRDSYYGGRTECFGNPREGEIIKYFDFSGMYGQCMITDFHNGNGRYTINGDYNQIGFHTIVYSSKDLNIPVLPMHGENGKLLFSNGVKVGCFWFEEIKTFLKYGGSVEKVISSLVFDRYEQVFSDFVEKFSDVKSKGGYYKLFGKLMINSLYGGLALKSEDEFVYFTFSKEEFNSILKNMTVKNFFKINEIYYLVISHDYKSKKIFLNHKKIERNVSYASAIASKGRIKLYEGYQEVIKDGGRILYSDTDSIFAGYPKSHTAKSCGSINWLEFYDDAVFIAPKTYGLKSKTEEVVKIKGVNLSKSEINFDFLKNKFYNNEKIVVDNQLVFKRSKFLLKQENIFKELWLGEYDKRVFSFDKKETTPITINIPDI